MSDRIAFLSVTSALSGGERYFLALAEAVARHHEVLVVGSAGTPFLGDAAARGLPTETIALGEKLGRRTAVANLGRWPQASRRLQGFLDEHAPQGAVVMQYKWEELLWGGRGHADRVALLEHGAIPRPVTTIPVLRGRLATAFRRARAVLATSEPAARSIQAVSDRAATRIPTGVDAERAEAAVTDRTRTRSELLAGGGPLLAYAGRMAENKGVLEAVRLLTVLPGATLVLAGEGEAAASVGSLAHRLGVDGRVRVLGHVADVLPVLAAADVVLLLTRDPGEGKPLVALEAGAVGTPVVGSRSSLAISSLVDAEGSGFVHTVDATDLDAVARVVRDVAARPRPRPVRPSWDDAAQVLLDSLGLTS